MGICIRLLACRWSSKGVEYRLYIGEVCNYLSGFVYIMGTFGCR